MKSRNNGNLGRPPNPILYNDTLESIEAYWAEHGYSPSIRDIAEAVGRVPSQMHAVVARLRDDGKINFEDNTPRSITLVGASWTPPSKVVFYD